MKRRIIALLTLGLMAASCLTGMGSTVVIAAQEEAVVLNDIPLVTAESKDPADIYKAELYNYKVIRNLETAYDTEQWQSYVNAANALLMIDAGNLDETAQRIISNAAELRSGLDQVKSANDCMWYIWGEDMPTAETEELEFTAASYDNADFRPYVVPYMLEEQSQVKGNIIMVSGGGFESRANDSEGFPAAHKFNELGYNCFLLQRRVAPYSTSDIFADLQRAVRYIRFYQEDLGLGATDKIIGMGWSGGAATVLGTVAMCYGDTQPTSIDEDYVPDEIDAVSSDFDVVVPVYGASYDFSEDYTGLETENTRLPAFFISMGTDDPIVNVDDAVALFNSVKGQVEAELHVFSQNAHGYGIGTPGTNSEVWPELADQFIQQAIRMRNDDTVEVCTGVEWGKIPEKYTKMQSFTGYAGFGTADVTVAVDDEESAYYIFYQAFGNDVTVAGLWNDGIVNNRFDPTKQFGASAAYIMQGVDENAWESVPDELRP